MDTLNTLLIGWMFFVCFVLFVAKLLYDNFIRKSTDRASENGTQEKEETCAASDLKGKLELDKSSSVASSVAPGVFRANIIPRKRQIVDISTPVATGGDPDAVRWLNNILTWLYHCPDGAMLLKGVWLDALNEYTVGNALETGVLIELTEILGVTPAPVVENVVVDCSLIDDITVTCDFLGTFYWRLQTTRTQAEVTKESEYACAVHPLRGRLKVNASAEHPVAQIKFVGWPEVSIELEGTRDNSTGLDEYQLKEVVSELLTSAMRNSVLTVDFLSAQGFPRFQRARQAPDHVIPVGYDSMGQTIPSISQGISGLSDKRLLVKIVKAAGLGCDKSVSECYVVSELDEPSQKYTTSVVRDTNSPLWNEQLLFELSDGTLELLFEVYDKHGNTFLGLGIVGIEELVATPSQRQIIPLQARPYENDSVSGSLTVEFLFLDRAELPDLSVRLVTTTQNVNTSGDVVTTTTTTYSKLDDKSSEALMNGDNSVANAALRDIKDKSSPLNSVRNASRSTVIIHSSKKLDGALVTTCNASRDDSYTSNEDAWLPGLSVTQPEGKEDKLSHSDVANSHETLSASQTDDESRSRPTRRKRRSFFGNLRKRLSGSKTRSKSVDPSRRDFTDTEESIDARSASIERSSRYSELLSVPSDGTRGEAGSTCSSLSETSGVSSSSTRTYVNEASLLVVEAFENGIVKHYLIPLSLQQRSKWRKKGTKLHVYNDHIFIAKHMPCSMPCQVCLKTLARRLGKQGYECRDCGFKCHKPCHVRVPDGCPNSTVNSMDLVPVQDPREERRAMLRKRKR